MWLPGAGIGGEDLTAKNAKGAKKRGLTTKARSNKVGRRINHKEHKGHKVKNNQVLSVIDFLFLPPLTGEG